MRLQNLVILVAVALSAVKAGSINHDQMQPFPQPESVTRSEQAAVKFKPLLKITDGCHPYPAVNAAVELSGGLKPTGFGGCKGSGLGSQINARAGWYSDLWFIMYAWYFPKNAPSLRAGRRHDWQHLVVWIDNPDANPLMMKAVSIWDSDKKLYDIHTTRLGKYRDGNSFYIIYGYKVTGFSYNTIELMLKLHGTETQDLIMWEQLTDKARAALEAQTSVRFRSLSRTTLSKRTSMERGRR